MSEPASLKYRAFISYSHADTGWAKWLQRGLESFKIDKDLAGRETARGVIPETLRPIFRDREDFTAGDALPDQTLAALDASHALIVVCSPNSARSNYVNEEARLFKSRHRDRSVIPLIVGGNPGDPRRECFPPALKFKLDLKGRVTKKTAEVLAADAREGGDGKKLALAKVVAGILGVSSDDIYRRAERDRRRAARVRVGIVGLLATLVAIGTFLGWLAQQRQQTLDEVQAIVSKYSPIGSAEAAVPGTRVSLTEAITAIAEGRADKRYAQALDLLKAGKPAEAEPLLRQVAEEKAAQVIQDSKEAAAAFRTLGAIAGLANPKRAREAYAQAIVFDPQDLESLYWHGWLNLLAGNRPAAQSSLNQLLQVATANSDQTGIYRAHLRLGEALLGEGRIAEARVQEDKAIAIAVNETTLRPNDFEWQRNLMEGYRKLGNVLLRSPGSLNEALTAFRNGLAIAWRLVRSDPRNQQWQYDLVVSQERIGDAWAHIGARDEALEWYQKSLAGMRSLASSDPNHLTWQAALVQQYQRVGRTLLNQGNIADSKQLSQDGLVIAERVAAADPSDAGFQRDLAVSYRLIGDVRAKHGNLTAALKYQRDALAIFERLTNGDPGSTRWQRDLALSHGGVGFVLARQGETAQALSEYLQAHEIATRAQENSSDDWDWQLAEDIYWYKSQIEKIQASSSNYQ
jgi:tetratricopeptide (TPR) repeat protein